MYTILLNDTNELITSIRERIMQRSKLVDSLHFLVDPIYKGIDMSDFTVMMEYIMPTSKEYKTEILVKSDELYKDKLEYTLPFDTCLTKEAGKIEIQLTFVKADLDAEGNSVQQVRKTSPTTITIVPIAAWSDIVPDSALTALDQRLLMVDAQIQGLDSYINTLESNKADNLVYDDKAETLQLTSSGIGIGDKISVRDMLYNGVPVVDLNTNSSNNNGNQDMDCNCDHNCNCGDNVVEFDNIPSDATVDDNIVEF